MQKYEAGDFDEDAAAADLLQQYEARIAALERLVGKIAEWTTLDTFLFDYMTTPELRRTVKASTFSVSLEMVKEGQIDLRQDAAFAPIWVRTKTPEKEAA